MAVTVCIKILIGI